MSMHQVVPTTDVPVRSRLASVDNLKVMLVAGVIVGHVTLAYTGIQAWTLSEPPVRDPLLSVLKLVALVGGLFAMATFFLIAGTFTPTSLQRKGLRRFLGDRTLRLGVPMLFFILVIAPFVEYADTDTAGWDEGFPAFVWFIWGHPAPGPTWFLGVLLTFSAVYALARTAVPRRSSSPRPMRARDLLVAMAFIAVAAWLIRSWLPLGEEYQHLALGQAPAWVAGFALGVMAGERGWFDQLTPAWSRRLFRTAWSAVAAVVLTIVTASLVGADIDAFGGGATWQSGIVAVLEGVLAVSMSLWLVDVFRRRVRRQGPAMIMLSRAAFAAFLVHQIVAVGAVLATRLVPWPPELEYATAATLAVVGSFAVGALLVRLPGVSRFV